MNSISARSWVGEHLQALGVTTKGLHGILHKHLAGTQTECVNFKKLVAELPEGTIAHLKGQFPGIAGEKTDAEFLYAVMCSRSGEDTQIPTFSHGKVFSRQVPNRITSTFRQSGTIPQNVKDLVRESIGDLKLYDGKTIEENLNGTNCPVSSINFRKMATMLSPDAKKSIEKQLPMEVLSGCKSNEAMLFEFMRMRLGPERAELLSCERNGTVQIKRESSPSDGCQATFSRSQTIGVRGKPLSNLPVATRELTRSSPVRANTTLSVASPAKTAQDENAKRLLAAKQLTFKRLDGDGYTFSDGQKAVTVRDLSQLKQCGNLEQLIIAVPCCGLRKLDLSNCRKLQHLECRLPDELEEICVSAQAPLTYASFSECNSLKKITLPTANIGIFARPLGSFFGGISTKNDVQIIANKVRRNPELGNPQTNERKNDQYFRDVTAQITSNADGTTTFAAPEPPKKSFFARLFGRK
ncbi:MAG: hypothetical protein LBI34_02715 [Puniceicoccales bacterium]|jgi:hypothetical protein|nr:hypothetical protein [Puniceicoccales bacterium]